MGNSSESHGTHDMNAPTSTAPLDESATVLPDGLDASLKALANVMEGRELRNFSTPSAVLLIRQAQSALAAMRVERDEALKAEQDWQEKATYEIGGVPHFWKDRAAAAESQVQRLTEEKEGLRANVREMHRRAQIAEGAVQSAQYQANMWRETIVSRKGDPMFYLALTVLGDIDRSLARATLNSGEKAE